MAIWLYYTKKGNLAKIQHGEALRQGSSFKIIYAFEDKDIILNKSLTVAFKKPGGEITPFYPVGKFTEQDLLSSTSRIRFNKIKSTEMTYGLQDNVEYYCLTGTYDPTITEKYGTLTVITKISTQIGQLDGIDEDRDGEIDNEEQDDTVYFQGSVQLYVEPTYGKQPESSNVSLDQYNALVEQINEFVSRKVNIENGLAKNLTLDGKTNATGEELNDELPSGIYVNEPTNEKHVVNKEYLDKSLENIYASKIKTTSERGNVQSDLDHLQEELNTLEASEILTSDGEKNVQEVLDDINIELEKQNHFKGIKSDISLFNDYSNYKPGDYCIVSKTDGDDILYIWDEGAEEDGPNTLGNGQWIEKGAYILGVKSVNFETPDENGNVLINSENIDFVEGTSLKDKIISIDDEILRFKGDWELYGTYNKNDIVVQSSYVSAYTNKSLYICLVEHQSDRSPSLDPSRWKLFVEGFSGDYKALINKPTDLQDFTNNGDGTEGSKYATEQYVQDNGGKINSLSANGEQLEIDSNKNVDIVLPTVIKLG